MANKDDPASSFLFVNKSTTSRTLSRSKAKEKAEIFRHVQRVRQKHDGQRQRQAARIDVPIETFETCWALTDATWGGTPREHEGSSPNGTPNSHVPPSEGDLDDQQDTTSPSSVGEEEGDREGTHAGATRKWEDPAMPRLTRDAIDPFDSFPQMAQYLPATEHCPHPLHDARSYLLSYIQSLHLTEYARKERLFHALTRPTVMFTHLMMLILENGFADEEQRRNLDQVFGVGALRHVRRELENVQDRCPWDLICLVNVFMIKAQVMGRGDVAQAHRGGLIAMIERNGGLRAFAATNPMAQAGANGLILGEMLASAITGEPLHPVLGDVAAGADFSTHPEDPAPISPLYCADGDFSSLEPSPHSRPETIQLLHSIWLLVHSVTQPPGELRLRTNSARNYYRARKAILASGGLVSPAEIKDYIYECCRLTAILLLNATETHRPLHSCAANVPIVHQIEQLLKSRASPASWGAFKGVYVNVVLVTYIASLSTSLRTYFHGLLSHALGYYACGVWDGAYRPLLALKQFQEFCRRESDPLRS